MINCNYATMTAPLLSTYSNNPGVVYKTWYIVDPAVSFTYTLGNFNKQINS